MKRVIIFDNLDNYIGDLSLADVMAMERHEEVNGEHSLTITTTQVLTQGNRVVYQDERGIWREYVVTGVDEAHTAGKTVVGSYYCVWSLLVDMQGVIVSVMPGTQTPVQAGVALDAILDAQSRWSLGTVTRMSTGGASMYDMSAWQALGVLVDNWGGEISATIEVSPTAGIVSRSVNLYDQIGELEAKRRYDFGRDVAGVTRHFEDSAVYCRISPRGKGEQTESGGYGRKIRITEVNDGKDYLEYAPMVDVAKLPDGNGGYQYPTLIVENSNCETPQDLLTWAQGILADTLTPKVSYDVDAVQTGVEGVDISGVSLGDVVQVVDRYFADGGIRITGRIVVMVIDELSAKNISVTIGDISESLATKFSDMQKMVDDTTERLNSLTGYLATADYVNSLIDRINTEINATGGYAYIVPGNGILTFDVAVADPLNPVEASQVVEIKGGSIRIANSKDAQGQWEWKTVFVSGHILADLVTAAKITTGFIGSAGGTYINLDQNIVNLGDETKSHVVVDNNGFYIYDGENLGVNIGGAKYEIGGTVISGVFYSFGPRANTGNNGLYSLSSGDSNYVGADSPYCGAIGYNLYAPRGAQSGAVGCGLAIGRYNVKNASGNYAGKEIIDFLQTVDSPAFVVGNGSSLARSNAFEVDVYGNIGFKGTLYSDTVGRLVEGSFSGVSCTDPLRNTLLTFTLPRSHAERDGHYGLWLIYVAIRFTGISNSERGNVFLSTSDIGTTSVSKSNISMVEKRLMFCYKNTSAGDRTLYLCLGDIGSNTPTASGSVRAIQLI